ncbi:hypothetical protein ACFLZB_04535, partial [Nanoarchaeota archaeon]
MSGGDLEIKLILEREYSLTAKQIAEIEKQGNGLIHSAFQLGYLTAEQATKIQEQLGAEEQTRIGGLEEAADSELRMLGEEDHFERSDEGTFFSHGGSSEEDGTPTVAGKGKAAP